MQIYEVTLHYTLITLITLITLHYPKSTTRHKLQYTTLITLQPHLQLQLLQVQLLQLQLQQLQLLQLQLQLQLLLHNITLH